MEGVGDGDEVVEEGEDGGDGISSKKWAAVGE